MLDDIMVEAGDEVEWTAEAKKSVSRATALMFKRRVATVNAWEKP
jgi:hypothetical protein